MKKYLVLAAVLIFALSFLIVEVGCGAPTTSTTIAVQPTSSPQVNLNYTIPKSVPTTSPGSTSVVMGSTTSPTSTTSTTLPATSLAAVTTPTFPPTTVTPTTVAPAPPSVNEQWVARYNGPVNGIDATAGPPDVRTMAVDAAGNVYVTGYSQGNGTGYDYATIKYNNDGVQQWVARYNGSGNGDDYAKALAVDASGNVYATGISKRSSNDYATIKYNSAGVQQWVAFYDYKNAYDDALAIAVDNSGNVYVTGNSYGSGTQSSNDYATVKYDSNGVQQWVVRYDGPAHNSDCGTALAVDASGNVYVTGYSYGDNSGNDYATVKYNNDGIQQWVARYNGPGNAEDNPWRIVVDGSGNVYVTGSSTDSGNNIDYATVKYNNDGTQQWVARYNGPGNKGDYATDLAGDGSGNVYVTGNSWGDDDTNEYATVKYNSNGVQQWIARYGINGDYATALVVDGSGNVYVTGASSGDNDNVDYATVKYNNAGIQQWVARYNGPGNAEDNARGIGLDSSGNVYVYGYSTGKGTNFDYAVIKYRQN